MTTSTRLLCFSALLLCAACYQPKEIKGPDGEKKVVIRCGLAHPEQCYADAAASCPSGYDEVSFNPGNLQTPIPHMLIVSCQ